MEKSLYFEYVSKFMPQLVTSVVEQMNEQNGAAVNPLLYPTYLRPVFTSDTTWQSLTAKYNRVAADVVALGSPVSSKQRDSLTAATGDIPKISILYSLGEKQMKDIDTMIAKGMPPVRIVQAIFADTPRSIDGVRERIEQMFLTGLSTGKALSVDSTGVGASVDYHYLTENQFATSASWDTVTTPVIADIEKVMDKCVEDRSTPTDVFLDDVALRRLYKNNDLKGQFAFDMGFAGNNVPMLSLRQVEQTFESRWGIRVHRIARRTKSEINGKFITTNPWKEGMMVFTCNSNLGDLVWTNTAEDTRRDPAVVYQNADDFILVSKYSERNPFAEFTKAEAMVVPVINNVEQIYTLDTNKVTA